MSYDIFFVAQNDKYSLSYLPLIDKIAYTINSNGTVTITRSETSESDPVIGKFIDFLAQDMEQNPQHIQPITSKTIERIQCLIEDVEIDLDASLPDEDE